MYRPRSEPDTDDGCSFRAGVLSAFSLIQRRPCRNAQITLPDSVVETKPRETVAIVVTPETVMVQGEAVVSTANLFDDRIGHRVMK